MGITRHSAAPARRRPAFLARLRARIRRLELDRALADGGDPASSPVLAARAAQLVSPPTREYVAACLEHFALTVTAPRGGTRTLPLRNAVGPNQAALLELARTLRHDRPVYAGGIAMLELVLTDGKGPAYTDPSGLGLADQLWLAAQGLSGHVPRPGSR